jgi:ribonuclease III
MTALEKLRAWLSERLGYQPVDSALFLMAVTHRSADSRNNERLEFLGDSVLNLVVAQQLFERFPQAPEGDLSRLRSRLVSGASLAATAAELELGGILQLGAGELKSGGFRRESILADALEALMGALYLEAGLDLTRAVLLRLLAAQLDSLETPEQLKDPKTRLQEWLQARGMPLPRYTIDAVEGDLHAQVFHVTCEVGQLAARAQGEGLSRRRAEQVAAQLVLEQLNP